MECWSCGLRKAGLMFIPGPPVLQYSRTNVRKRLLPLVPSSQKFFKPHTVKLPERIDPPDTIHGEQIPQDRGFLNR